MANNLQDKPGFNWWVKHTLCKQKHIIAVMHSSYARHTHKFGIKVPSSPEEALKIDKETNTMYWYDAIQKELKNVKVALKFPYPDTKAPIGFKWIKCHMIFDDKMDFTHRAHYVAGGHMTDLPTSLTYSSVVSRDSMRIAF